MYLFDNGADAVHRYEVRAIYDVLADNPDEETKALMETALSHLDTNTGGNYDLGAAASSGAENTDTSAGTDTGDTSGTDTGGTE